MSFSRLPAEMGIKMAVRISMLSKITKNPNGSARQLFVKSLKKTPVPVSLEGQLQVSHNNILNFQL